MGFEANHVMGLVEVKAGSGSTRIVSVDPNSPG